ncbi:MAG TPA: hypothetical protein VE262_13790 [Blastocatellia bacterium]|nr:hypothetical protein [Blastocatellia bacterium]
MGENTDTDLKAISFGAPYEYVGILAANVPQPTEDTSQYEKVLYAATADGVSLDESSDTGGLELTFDVPSGNPALFGGIGNWQDGEVPGSWMTVQKPNGSFLNVATSPAASDHMVLLPTHSAPPNSVLNFVVLNPEVGTWRITVGDSSGTTPYQAIVTTMPTSAQPSTIIEETLGALVTQGTWEDSGARWDPICDICKVGAYSLALGIAGAAAAAGTAILTVDSALVIATAGFLGVTAPVALALIAGLLAMATLTVDYIMTQLCNWVGACD